MPELPEVETLRRGLDYHLKGRAIEGIRIAVPKMVKGSTQDAATLGALLCGSRISSVGRRGKHLILMLDSGYYLLFHLNMRGQLLVVPRETREEKYFALALAVEGGQELRFHDMWTWGEMRLVTQEELDRHPALLSMGPEPFSPEWTPSVFRAGLARRAGTAIKAALLDQKVVAGVGNIYADESLFRSGIHPERPAGSLTPDEVACLLDAIRGVLTEATGGGGTTSDNYVDADGQVGRYRPRVYDRAGQRCPGCGQILTRTKITGRGTTYCPCCQM